MSSRPPAARYGALAYAWSRNDRITNFGDNGLAVFHAGHCDWQRPHSVQVVKSSQPFQEKSSTLPAPKVSTSGSAFSKSSTWPREHHRPQRRPAPAPPPCPDRLK